MHLYKRTCFSTYTIHLNETELPLKLRPGSLEDAEQAGKIIFEAFAAIANDHGFPPDFPSVDAARNVATSFLSNPGFYSVVAEYDHTLITYPNLGHIFNPSLLLSRGTGPIEPYVLADLYSWLEVPNFLPQQGASKLVRNQHFFIEIFRQNLLHAPL
jgi:hypothetical protein